MKLYAPMLACVAVTLAVHAADTGLPATPELRALDAGRIPETAPGGTAAITVPADLPAGAGLRLVAPRGGVVSAPAVLRAEKLAAVAATPPALVGPAGARLPASAVQVRWLRRAPGGTYADTFAATPTEAQVQPLLLTVTVPTDAAPGVYTGSLAVIAQGFTGALPVQLEVAKWLLPAPRDWPFLTGLIHSPDTVALHYKVEPWSDAHLKLMEPSLRLLRDLGSESCYLFLISQALIYERYSIVRWRDGKPDFACVDRYLDLWQKVCGTPKKITLHVWEGNRQPHLNAANSVSVTRIAADGALETFKAPYYDTPEAEAFWKPVYDGIRAQLAKRGWKDTEVLLGLPWDCHPSEEAIAFFKKVAPGWRWRVFTHGFNIGLPNADGHLILACGAEVGWFEGAGAIEYGHRSAGMDRVYPFTISCRSQAHPASQGWVWRDIPIHAIRGRTQGLSQVGLDYWGLNLKPGVAPGLRAGSLIQIGFGGFNPRHELANSITVPGPSGAEPTLQYELLREGLQAAAAFAVARDTASGKAMDALMRARLDCALGGKLPDRAAITHDRWCAALGDLYAAAAQVVVATPVAPRPLFSTAPPVPITGVTVTQEGGGAERGVGLCVDGSGLDAAGLRHGTADFTMWRGYGVGTVTSITFTLGTAERTLAPFHIWNYNRGWDIGIKDVTIAWSADNGATWTTAGTARFKFAPDRDGYQGFDCPLLDGVKLTGPGVKKIRLSNMTVHGGEGQMGLSEIRFYAYP